MTEQEAILSLIDDIQAGEQKEAVNEENLESNGEQRQESVEKSPESGAENLKALIAKNAKNEEPTEVAQEPKNGNSAEQQALLDSLGIENLPQVIEQLKAFSKAQESQAQRQRQQEIFDKNSAEFKKDFPTIKLEELGEFAEKNGFLPLLNEDYLGWKAVATAMINLAKSNDKPDEIIGNNRTGTSLSAFERQQKGERVSDIELGAELLKSAGLI